MKPRIFISHSTKGTDDRPILTLVCDILREENFDVFVDDVVLEPGDHWRKKLVSGLGHCDGGLILFNAQAQTDSHWVHAEATILRWLDWVDEDFVLIPILINDGRVELLQQGKWKPLEFSEVQAFHVTVEKKSPKKKHKARRQLKEVLRSNLLPKLNTLKTCAHLTVLEKMEIAIAEELKDTPTVFLNEAIRVLNDDMPPSDPQLKPHQRLARQLLRGGCPAFGRLLHCVPTLKPESAKRILAWVAPAWVDLRAAGRIPKIVSKKEYEKRAFSVYGKHHRFTGRMYIQRAWCRGSAYSWPVIDVTAKSGEDIRQYVVKEIRDGLIATLFGPEVQFFMDPPVTDEDINAMLEHRDALKEPVFVVLPSSLLPDGTLMKTIRKTFPRITIFFFTKPKHAKAANIELLEPELTLKKEKEAFGYYLRAHTHFQGSN